MPGPQRRRLSLNQGNISYLEWPGDGLAVHFAHANGFNAQTYCALLSPLSPDFHVTASDARGHGFTDLPAEPGLAKNWTIMRDDLTALLDALGPAPIILAGHSLGAITSLMLAVREPRRVSGLVLVEPVLVPENSPGEDNPGVALAALTRRRREKFSSFDEVFKAYCGRPAFETWPEDVLADYLKGGLKPDGDGVRLACTPSWEAAIYDNTKIGASKLVVEVQCPVTLIYGDSNSTVPEDEADIFRAANARVVKVTGASHFLPMEHPEIVRDEIRRMAKRVG
jgi:pimeloyl-ACP methyl ester carboxylesterase